MTPPAFEPGPVTGAVPASPPPPAPGVLPQGGPGPAAAQVAMPLMYFGKLPSRGDFLRSSGDAALLQRLDRWLAEGIEALAADPHWKLLYDQAAPLHFAFLHSLSPSGLAGHLLASTDASGRRYPFITACRLQIDDAAAHLAHSPLLLAPTWAQLQTAAGRAHRAEDAGTELALLAQQAVPVAAHARGSDGLAPLLDHHTVGSLQRALRAAGHTAQLRQIVLGLGLLLQQVASSGARRLDKGLLLPLPQDPAWRMPVAALWLELVGGFLTHADFALALCLPQPAAEASAPVLALGFDGASAHTLHALLAPLVARDFFVDACQAEWVEDQIGHDYALHKLSSYLQQDGLSLRQALDTFKEAFLGV